MAQIRRIVYHRFCQKPKGQNGAEDSLRLTQAIGRLRRLQ